MQATIQSRPEGTDGSLHTPGLNSSTASPVLNSQSFDSLRTILDPATLGALYADLLKQTRLRLDALGQASELRDIAAAAHAIRGSAGMLGAAALADLAAVLEADPVPAGGLHQAVEGMRSGCAALESTLRERQVAL